MLKQDVLLAIHDFSKLKRLANNAISTYTVDADAILYMYRVILDSW